MSDSLSETYSSAAPSLPASGDILRSGLRVFEQSYECDAAAPRALSHNERSRGHHWPVLASCSLLQRPPLVTPAAE
jgi:hypothetical protein